MSAAYLNYHSRPRPCDSDDDQSAGGGKVVIVVVVVSLCLLGFLLWWPDWFRRTPPPCRYRPSSFNRPLYDEEEEDEDMNTTERFEAPKPTTANTNSHALTNNTQTKQGASRQAFGRHG